MAASSTANLPPFSRTRSGSLPKSRSQDHFVRQGSQQHTQQPQQQQYLPWHLRLQQIEALLSEPAVLRAFCAFLDTASQRLPGVAQPHGDSPQPIQQQKQGQLVLAGTSEDHHLRRFLTQPQTAQALHHLQRLKRLTERDGQGADRDLLTILSPAALKLECSLRLDLALSMLWSAAKIALAAEPLCRPSAGLRSPAPIPGHSGSGGGSQDGLGSKTALDPNPLRRAALPILNSLSTLMLTERDFIPLNNLQRSRAGIVEVVRCRLNRKLYVLKSILKGVARREPHRTSPMTEKELLCLAASSGSSSSSSIAQQQRKTEETNERSDVIQRPDYTPQICAAFQSTGSLHIVMEYFPAGDLNTFLESAGSASVSSAGAGAVPGRNPSGGLLVESWVQMYAADIVAAVGWVHERGFAHRDVKPSNFLMDYTGHLKLCDFSTAAPVSTFDVSGGGGLKERRVRLFHCREPAGTCDYIAPEILLYEEQRLAAESSWDESCLDLDEQSGIGGASFTMSASASASMSVSLLPSQSRVHAQAHHVFESSVVMLNKLGDSKGENSPPIRSRSSSAKLQPPAVVAGSGADRSSAGLKRPFGDSSNTVRPDLSALSGAGAESLPSEASTEKGRPAAGSPPSASEQQQQQQPVIAAVRADETSVNITQAAPANLPASEPDPNGPGGYGPEVDWWSVGVVVYEMTFGKLPFWARDPAEAFQKIMNHSKFLHLDESVKCSADLRDLIKCLIASREQRLGSRATEDVKAHPFFKNIDWAALHSMEPPFVPAVDRTSVPGTSNMPSAGSSPDQSPSYEQEPSVLHSPSPSVWRARSSPARASQRPKGKAAPTSMADLETSMSMMSIVSPVSFSALYQGRVDDFPAFVNESDRDEELSAMCAEHEGDVRDLEVSHPGCRGVPVTQKADQSALPSKISFAEHQDGDVGSLWDDIDLEWTGFTLQPQASVFTPSTTQAAAPSSVAATPAAPRTVGHKNEVRFAPALVSNTISEQTALPAIDEVEGRPSSAPPAASTPYTRRVSDLSSLASPDPIPSHLTTPYTRVPAGNTMPRSLQRRAVEAAGWARVGIDSRFVTPMRKTSLPNFGSAISQANAGGESSGEGGVGGGQRSVSAPKAGLPSPYPFPVIASRRTSTGEPAASMPSRQRSGSHSRGESRSRSASPAVAADPPVAADLPSSGSDSRFSGGSITKRDFSEREAWDRMMKAVQKSAKKKRLAEDERMALTGAVGQLTIIHIDEDDEWSLPGHVIASPPSVQTHQGGGGERGIDKFGSMGSNHSERDPGQRNELPRWSSSCSIASEGARRHLASYDWLRGEVPARTSSRSSLLPEIVSPTSKRQQRERASDAEFERSISGSLSSMDHSRVPSRQSNASTPPGGGGMQMPQSISSSSLSSSGSLSDLDGEAAQTRWTLRQRRSTRQLLIKAQERTTPSKGPRARVPSLTSLHSLSTSDSAGAGAGVGGGLSIGAAGGGSMRMPKARPASLFGWSSLGVAGLDNAEDRGMLSAPLTGGFWAQGPNLSSNSLNIGHASRSSSKAATTAAMMSARRRSVADFSLQQRGQEHRAISQLRGDDVRRKGSHEILREYSQGLRGSSVGPTLSTSSTATVSASGPGPTSTMPKSSSSRQGSGGGGGGGDWARSMDDRHLALQRNIDEIEGRITQLRARLRQEEEERRFALTELKRLAAPATGPGGSATAPQADRSDRTA